MEIVLSYQGFKKSEVVCLRPSSPPNQEDELKILSLQSKTSHSMSSKNKEASFPLDLCLQTPALPFFPQWPCLWCMLPTAPSQTGLEVCTCWLAAQDLSVEHLTLYKLNFLGLFFFISSNQGETGQQAEKLLGQLAARQPAWQHRFCSSKKGDDKLYVLYLFSEFGDSSVWVTGKQGG